MTTPPTSVAQATGAASLGQRDPEPADREAAHRGDDEGQDELEDEAPRRRLTAPRDQLAQARGKGQRHRRRGARLDHHVEEVGLARQQPHVLHEEQMAGRGDREEFRDALDDAQGDHGGPVGHRRGYPAISSPPSTPITLPVIQWVSGCESTTMARATSSVVVMRRLGFRSMAFRENSS